MASINHEEIGVARVYARSMLALGLASGKTEELLSELAELGSLVEQSPQLARLLRDPLLGAEERRGVIEKLFRGKASDLFVDSLQVVARKNRLMILPAITESLRLEYQRSRGIVDVFVTSAVPLRDALRSRLVGAIERRTGQTCHLMESVDPGILGGLIVQVGDQKMDTSVARELSTLSGAFAGRASKEILSGKAYTAEDGA